MESRDGSRWEYVKQPHIMLLIAVTVFVIVGALSLGYRRVSNNLRRSDQSTFESCFELVKDENLCKFAEKNQEMNNGGFVVTSTTTNGSVSEVTTSEVESSDRMKSVTLNGLQETESFVVIDSITYYLDYSDNTWAKYDDPEFQPSQDGVSYDFTSENSKDVIEFRDAYKFESMEPCGEYNCFKYKISNASDATAYTYIWFDDKEFKQRRSLEVSSAATTNSQFEYKPVKIEAPSPTKDISQEDLESDE